MQQGGPIGAESYPATDIAADINWVKATLHGAMGSMEPLAVLSILTGTQPRDNLTPRKYPPSMEHSNSGMTPGMGTTLPIPLGL